MEKAFTFTAFDATTNEYTTFRAYKKLEDAFEQGEMFCILHDEWKPLNVLGSHQWTATNGINPNVQFRIEEIELI